MLWDFKAWSDRVHLDTSSLGRTLDVTLKPWSDRVFAFRKRIEIPV